MLSHLTIRSLAVIDSLEFECARGMTALTGETGAGKSIVVDALALLLGARASSDMIRAGAERAEVCGVFETSSNASARAWLACRDLEEDAGECIVRRVVGPGSRSRSFVNHRPVPANLLRELGEHLVDIHGQHEHHLLLDRDRQRIIVDDFGGHHELLEQVAETAGRWHALRRKLAEIASEDEERTSRLDFLRFQLGELEGLGLDAGEPEGLANEQRRLANAESILDGCRRALDRLDGDHDGSAAAACAGARRDLEPVARHDSRARGVLDLLDTAAINLTEARHLAASHDGGARPRPRAACRGGAPPGDHSRFRPQAPGSAPGPAGADRSAARAGRRPRRERATGHGESNGRRRGSEEEHRALCTSASPRLRREASGTGLRREVARNMQELGMPGGGFAVDIRPRDGSAPFARAAPIRWSSS